MHLSPQNPRTTKPVLRCLHLAALLLAAGSFQSARAANLVLDGGFESATACNCAYTAAIGDGWTTTQGTMAILSHTYDPGVGHSGAQFAYLDWGVTANTLSQTLVTVPGQSYTVSYWVADDFANSLKASFGSQVLFDGSAPTLGVAAPGNYVNHTFTVVATSTSTTLSFTGQWTFGNGTLLDDVSVTPVIQSQTASAPLNTTALVCLAGLLCLFAAVQFRRIFTRQRKH